MLKTNHCSGFGRRFNLILLRIIDRCSNRIGVDLAGFRLLYFWNLFASIRTLRFFDCFSKQAFFWFLYYILRLQSLLSINYRRGSDVIFLNWRDDSFL